MSSAIEKDSDAVLPGPQKMIAGWLWAFVIERSGSD
jgi:hypothetical protein